MKVQVGKPNIGLRRGVKWFIGMVGMSLKWLAGSIIGGILKMCIGGWYLERFVRSLELARELERLARRVRLFNECSEALHEAFIRGLISLSEYIEMRDRLLEAWRHGYGRG